MLGRDTAESHRVSTPLELLFDLCFVVAVAQAAARLHHAETDGRLSGNLLPYLLAFFSVWWAWMNFSWFASAYDTDDVPYRLAVLVQIAGVLVLAAGVPRAFEHRDFDLILAGYAIMRAGLVSQFLRAARGDPARRTTALRYSAGYSTILAGWAIVLLVLPDAALIPGWLIMGAGELSVPMWAERAARTPWHPHHIAERYGLFTIIVLGESVSSATDAVRTALDAEAGFGDLAPVAVGGLLILFAMWWVYFSKPAHALLVSNRVAFTWGYGHYCVFASAAAVGAGLSVAVDHATGEGTVSDAAAGAAVTVPVAAYLLVLWALHVRPHHTNGAHHALFLTTTALVLAATFTGQAVLTTGLLLSALVAVAQWNALRAPRGRQG